MGVIMRRTCMLGTRQFGMSVAVVGVGVMGVQFVRVVRVYMRMMGVGMLVIVRVRMTVIMLVRMH